MRRIKKPSKKTAHNGKFPHVTRASAVWHKLKLVERGAAEWQLNVYKCPFCPAFHVGHITAKGMRGYR